MAKKSIKKDELLKGQEAKSEVSDANQDSTPNSNLTIIGVGASAGGIEAFTQLLQSLPPNPNFAIILVQHLAPQHESVLAMLFTPATELPVQQIEENTIVEPNHVYIIPPNQHLVLEGNELQLLPRPTDSSQYNPIDVFFRSLAESQPKPIGVILSGTGTDGVDGIHAIKAVGGVVVVQEPETCKFDSLPHAAIGTGKTDLVLPAEQIGPAVVDLMKSSLAHSIRPRRDGDELVLSSNQLDSIFTMLRGMCGVDFSQYKLPTVQRRILRRIAMQKVPSVDHYIKYLQENPVELNQLYHEILIHVTKFFREPESFDALLKEVFPRIIESRQQDATIRIWVPACSTGEEPYSVAMSLLEYIDGHEPIPIQIFATDVSEVAIEQARTGVFPLSISEDVSAERLRRFFTRTDGSLRINKAIRDLCIFARQDLTRDPPFSKIDLIVCRNVLIYLGQSIQKKLMSVFHYALKPTGFMMLGTAETIGMHADLFSIADKKSRIYKKKLVETPSSLHFAAPYNRPVVQRLHRRGEELRAGGSIQSEANQLVLDRYAPPGVIINDDMLIVQFRGQTGLYLEPAPGDASLNLLKMCREGLLHSLRSGIQAAKKQEGTVIKDGLRVKTNGGYHDVRLEIIPMHTIDDGRHYLILFHDETTNKGAVSATTIKEKKQKKSSPKENQAELTRLQNELIANREYLQSIIQDLEAANEELQSANEEILSSNEELQSTNEELDTAKEELQSTNEELNTVNEELHGRNDELARSNSDLVNLVNSAQIAIVIVAGDLRIRRFTPMAERVLNLIPGDIGRPISQIKPNIDCPDLEKLIIEVIDTITVQHREVCDSQGRWFSLSIRPYKNVDNRIDGAVLALFNLDEIRRFEVETQKARDYADILLRMIKDPFVILTSDYVIKSYNAAFGNLFRINGTDFVSRSFYELAGGSLDTEEIRAFLESDQQRASANASLEVVVNIPAVGLTTAAMIQRRLPGVDKELGTLIVTLQISHKH